MFWNILQTILKFIIMKVFKWSSDTLCIKYILKYNEGIMHG